MASRRPASRVRESSANIVKWDVSRWMRTVEPPLDVSFASTHEHGFEVERPGDYAT